MNLTEQDLAPVIEIDANTGNVIVINGKIILGDGVELTRLREYSYFTPDKLDDAKVAFGNSLPAIHDVLDAVKTLPVSVAAIADAQVKADVALANPPN